MIDQVAALYESCLNNLIVVITPTKYFEKCELLAL